VVVGCTPAQIDRWVAWYETDPTAAVEFANQPEVQMALSAGSSAYDPAWDRLAWCESGGNWSYNGGSGYDGGLQFLPAVWTAYGGGEFAAYAWQASPADQVVVAERILADVGWSAWPACSRKLGLR
jgi:resuscitation-promoting factor RpfA